MKKVLFAAVAVAAAALTGVVTVGSDAGSDARPTRYVVLYGPHASAAMKAAVVEARGRVVKANNRVGVATVISANPRFLSQASAAKAIQGVAHNRIIGTADPGGVKLRPKFSEEIQRSLRNASRGQKAAPHFRSAKSGEPLADKQWDMKMIHATVDGSYKKEPGNRKVLVGVIDTGVDGNHPDIAPNFNRSLSRNFTADIEAIDGPCEFPGCVDPNDRDDNGHGTHVASTIGSPINGLGVAGVAPNITLVNLRAGQDSGFFFLQPSVDAFTYAGDHGIDVVNMSYFVDPWLYNCRANAADSPTQQAEQQTIIEAMQRGIDYAYQHGVTMVAAAGNDHSNLAQATGDNTSPDYPPGTAYHRDVDNNCLVLPEQGNHVISVSSVGPSTRKSDFSNYGYEKIDVAAPGGWFRDTGWTPANPIGGLENQILAAYPKNVAEASGDLNPDGTPNTPFVVRDCKGSTCAYYQWIQGTSMASPHVAGVAALIVSQYGHEAGGRITLPPLFTKAYLQASATNTPCMTPNPFSYAAFNRPASYDTFCEGTEEYNGVYGDGIVDALRAVEIGHDLHVG